MTKDKYLEEISKKLLCKKDKKKEIIKQICSDIDSSLEDGDKLEDVLSNMGTPSEVADEFNDNFDEADKESICKIRKRNKILIIVGIVGVLLMFAISFVMPKSKSLDKSKIFSDEEVISKAKQIIQLVDEEKYEEINNQSTEKLKSANLAKVIPEGKASISKDFGKFMSYGKIYTAEQKQLGVTYAVVQVNLSYENVSVTYTISFDEDMKLAGIYIK